MPDIKINGTTTNAALPSVRTTKQQIASLAGYKAWLRSQDGYMTTVDSGGNKYVSQFQDYGGGASVFNSTEASPKYAKRITDSIGGFEAAYFEDPDDAADLYDRYDASGVAFDWTQAWTVFGVAQGDASLSGTNAALVGVGSTGADSKVFIGVAGTNFSMSVGNAGSINVPFAATPFWFIASFFPNAAASKFSFEVNALRGVDVTRAPLGASTGTITCGSFGNAQGWKGPIRELLFLQESVHYGVDAAAKRDLLRKHAQRIYGL
jgi:hypothetical protein